MSAPRISVLIPVYRDWQPLADCLQALSRQDWPATDFEVLVINNDTAPPAAELALPPGVTLLQAPQGHSYAARNAGLAVARGQVLAFTDADCRPEPGWLSAGWAALEQGADLAGGAVRIDPARRGLIADHDRAFAFQQQAYVAHGGAVTANLFVRRAVFEAIGRFNAGLQSGGDFEFCRRAVAAGWRLAYADTAEVTHPPRDSVAALLRKNRRVACGLRRSEYEMRGQPRHAVWLRVLRMLAQPRLRLWWRQLRGRESTAALPPARRPAVVALQVLLYYHYAWSLLRAPPEKHEH